MTVRRYLDILEGTFMVRILQPWFANTGKRLVKRPKIYFRDSGLLHALLAVRSREDLASNNKLGASWEGFALETAAKAIGKRNEELAFWATHSGAEVDLFWREHGKNWAIEIKYADAPRLTASMASAMKDLELAHLWVLYPGDRAYALADGISALPLEAVEDTWKYE
jgi:predicted AAA+ superfamily ATPase